ncbi:MAG: hypothetical protein ACE5HE_10325 [Phycisphaerae bacterium]
MPYNDPDRTDPMALHGVVMETDSDRAMVEMAACFIEEYARLGFDAGMILRLFHTPGYAGPAIALQELGEARIRGLISDEIALRGSTGSLEECQPTTPTGVSLPVLDTGLSQSRSTGEPL